MGAPIDGSRKVWDRRQFGRTLAAAAVSLALPGAIAAAPKFGLQGTFLQLLNVHIGWTRQDWTRLFAEFSQLRLSTLVVQWSVHDETPLFNQPQHAVNANAPLEMILSMADAANMNVYLGLVHDSQYWEHIKQAPEQVEAYLRQLLDRSATTASQLRPLTKAHSSFKGWYISQEVDDLNWEKPALRSALIAYLEQLSGFLRVLTPEARISMSGFANSGTDPKQLEDLWQALLAGARAIDLVFFQDSIGVAKLSLAKLPDYLAAVGRAVDSHLRVLQTVVEVFRQDHGAPIDNQAFHAVPASLERIEHQIEIARNYSSGIIAFGIPEYMSASGTPEAASLFRDYLVTSENSKK
ncbi:DUF4434 domain-containing protein [Paraherbaspirillum soli]|uniref:DUF4434 domain-containing protein n=1 Tax=Paraherbaspirillum soli TaxID=631222 RepID=A0ABW0M3D4_9BURK